MNTIHSRFFDDVSAFGRQKTEKIPLRIALRSDRLKAMEGIENVLGDHLRTLLNLLVLTQKGKPFHPDGFLPVNRKEGIVPLFPSEASRNEEPADLLEIYEPRLACIRRLVESLLSLVEFEFDSQKICIDGLRLKYPEQWLSPGGGAIDILAHAGTRCNLKCRFCYNKGSPPAFRTKPPLAEASYQDVLSRISLYKPELKLGIFPLSGSLCEVLTHPRIKEILDALRNKTDELIRIPTNGHLLSFEMIDFLCTLPPVFLDISLNSSSAARRSWLMGDPKPWVAIKSLSKLQSRGIPFSVVIVPWPFPSVEEMLTDLGATIHYAQAFDPAYIQISLPAYSRFFSPKTLFDHEAVWERIKEAIFAVRGKTDCPIILRPGLYEEYLDPLHVKIPKPIGIVRNSPLARAGMKAGDRLLAVNGLKVETRVQARFLLTMFNQSDLKKTEVLIERDQKKLKFEARREDYGYPYDESFCPYLGIVFPSAGVPISWVEMLSKIALKHQAKHLLVMTSKLVAPSLEENIRRYCFPADTQIHLHIPANKYFGGNIFMGDLLIVDDFVSGVKEFIDETKHRPDVIVVPASPFHLSGWGRDLTGKVYLEIERQLCIPVVLIDCNPIFD